MSRDGATVVASTRHAGSKPTGRRLRPIYDHLDALTDSHGLFEHALHASPRPEHGYCLDDVARGLVVTCRERRDDPVVTRLRDGYLDFVLAAVTTDGRCHNRMAVGGRWTDEPGLGDWWGRAVWALGVASSAPVGIGLRARALAGFRVAAQRRSPYGRAMAFAALGAGHVLGMRPSEPAARALLQDAVAVVNGPPLSRGWPWPEPRLRYANATVAEALLVGGTLLPDAALRTRGLELLAFLLRVETRDGHLSVTPVDGRGPHQTEAGFDQQPIEVAAIADACATAYRLTTDPRWLTGINLAWRWFDGDNDSGTRMFDSVTGGGYDGLQADGANLNQGAESTLAMLSTSQHARHVRELR